MAAYMPQPDSGNTCCDCPDRTSPCDDCTTTTGACCNLSTFSCTDGVTHDDCVASGGIYLGDGSACTETTCTCCPMFDHYTEVHLSGQVLGCSGGTVNLPEKVWTKVASGPGCDVNTFEFAHDGNCGCQFQAQDCIPFNEVDYVEIDEIGDCSDPNTYFGCTLVAHISCAGSVIFAASTGPTQCCNVTSVLVDTGGYDLTAGPLDVTLNANSGDPSIQFRFILSLA